MTIKQKLLQLCTTKFYYVRLALGRSPITLLDVGLVNNSIRNAKIAFGDKLEIYDGIDIIEHSDLQISNFYKIDLEKDTLDQVPNNAYECVLCNHVLEHLDNPLIVSRELIRKVKADGCIFFEFPSEKSAQHFSLFGMNAYHFHDDPTHKKLVCPREICNLLLEKNFRIVSSGSGYSIYRHIASLGKFFLFALCLRNPLKAIPHLTGRIHHIVAVRIQPSSIASNA